jgi:hypothetical protein
MAILQALGKIKDLKEQVGRLRLTEQIIGGKKRGIAKSENPQEDVYKILATKVGARGKTGFLAPILADEWVMSGDSRAKARVVFDAIQEVSKTYDKSVYGKMLQGIILRKTIKPEGVENDNTTAVSYINDIMEVNVPLLHDWSERGDERAEVELKPLGIDSPDKIRKHTIHHEIGHSIFRKIPRVVIAELNEKISLPPSFTEFFSGIVSPKESLTTYGRSDLTEWFAEHWALYKMVPEVLKHRKSDFYDFMSKVDNGSFGWEDANLRKMRKMMQKPLMKPRDVYSIQKIRKKATPSAWLTEAVKAKKRKKQYEQYVFPFMKKRRKRKRKVS